MLYEPYFYVAPAASTSDVRTREVVSVLEKKYEGLVTSIHRVEREDLQMANHLSGRKREFLQLKFRNVSDLMSVRNDLKPIIDKNAAKLSRSGGMMDMDALEMDDLHTGKSSSSSPLRCLVDIREYDVPYYQRVSIDTELRVGSWYRVSPPRGGTSKITKMPDFMENADPRVLAFDIECTKAPLKFPDAAVDNIYMISYMTDGQGYLLINREFVSQDVPDFEYTPLPEFKGPFKVINLANEEEMLKYFFSHVRELKPNIFVTYNGDFFDWPFIENRARAHGLDMKKEMGVVVDNNGEYRARVAAHMDCLYWVKRDSYLPQGSHGLKSVTKAKLGYDPVEIDPEDMLNMARDSPLHMASYSVSDAVATYYLYQKYVHSFIYSLCTIIPLGPDDVLRKGSGTLCESLLMVEAFRGGIICPNKDMDALGRTFEGHVLDTETYLGGHVECLESGVFRSDLPTQWKLVPTAFQELIDKVDRALTFAIEVEADVQRNEIANYDAVRSAIVEKLELLRDTPMRIERPVIYHLDVAAMYPNIILTNRLQPGAMVNEDVCASCDFSTDPANRCQRTMDWRWRGEYFPANREETEAVRMQLMNESFDGTPFADLPAATQDTVLKARLKVYSAKAHKRVKDTIEMNRDAVVCQRENPFYVNTVRAFRDRRYEYKGLTKTWTKKLAAAEKAGNKLDAEIARNRMVLMDSLQLAHKCILNSFYGYVMRKGARWHSMEMAGVVTFTGSKLIQQARTLVEQVGRPLEIDTDGIWCILPASFPQDFAFVTNSGARIPISYPCVMLNADVHDNYTNHQYQELLDPSTCSYSIRSECSIFFELDGPWRAMILPASQEEGKLLKKRYAVFAKDGSLSELKGFEMKRRGELKMVKVFQSQVFDRFMEGGTLEECYGAVAEVADYWLNILDTQGEDLDDSELIEYLSENRSLTRTVEDYGEQKSVAISTAKRLAEFLGADMVKDKGLACKLLVAKKPAGAPVTDRAIPTTIFEAEPEIMRYYLRKWCKDSSMNDFNIRSILDWDYYRTRLGATIQKIITIPAGLQGVRNPVPRIVHPDWLLRLVASKASAHRQTSLMSFYDKGLLRRTSDRKDNSEVQVADIEDGFAMGAKSDRPLNAVITKHTIEDVEDVVDVAASLLELEHKEEVMDWLKSRREIWKRQRADSRRGRVTGPTGGGDDDGKKKSIVKLSKGKLTVASLYRTPAGAATMADSNRMAWATLMNGANRAYWQILEVRYTARGDAGVFSVFALTGQRKLQIFDLHMERIIYLNRIVPFSDSAAAVNCELVSRRLPHDFPPYYLYQMSMPEGRFLRYSRQITKALEGGDPAVAGVYETQMPLLLRALLKLGCVARLNKQVVAQQKAATAAQVATAHIEPSADAAALKAKRSSLLAKGRSAGRTTLDGFLAESTNIDVNASHEIAQMPLSKEVSSRDLELLTTSSHPYLTHITSSYRLAFLYHSMGAEVGAHSTTLLFVIRDTNTMLATKYVTGMVAALREDGRTPGSIEEAVAGLDESAVHRLLSQADNAIPGVHVPLNVTVYAFFAGEAPAPGSKAPAFPPMRKLFTTANDRAGAHPENTAEFKPAYVATQADGWKKVSNILNDLNPSNSPQQPPLITVTASCLGKQALLQLIPALQTLPVIAFPYSSRMECAYPSIGWAPYAVARSYINVFRMLTWWHTRLEISRYCQVPVSNIMLLDSDSSMALPFAPPTPYDEPDLATRMADLFFARMLQFNKHVLWATAASFPDLGGVESDAVSSAGAASSTLSLLTDSANGAGNHRSSDRLPGVNLEEVGFQGASKPFPSANPHLSAPGMYRCIAVELTMENLAVNTVLNSSHLQGDDVGGTDPLAAYEAQYETELQVAMEEVAACAHDATLQQRPITASVGAVDTGSCVGAFKALKRLLASWFSDYKTHGNVLSGVLLKHFYTWLASSTSLLHDPALHRLVHALMRKTFDVLVRTLRSSGLHVIHASFDKIIVSTGKTSVPAAATMLKHVLAKVAANPLFQYLSLSPVPDTNWWHSLLFIDEFNFAGIKRTVAPVAEEEPSNTHAAPKLDVLESAAESILREAVTNLRAGEHPGQLNWKALEKEFITEATHDLSLDCHWSFGTYLHSSAEAMLNLVIGLFMLKPLREACRRSFLRLRKKFEEHVIPTLESDAGAATAHLLVREAGTEGSGSGVHFSPSRTATRALIGGSPMRVSHSDDTPGSIAAKLSLPAIHGMVKMMSKDEETAEQAAETEYITNLVATSLRDKLCECITELEKEAELATGPGADEGTELLNVAAYNGDDQDTVLKLAKRTVSVVADPKNFITSSLRTKPALPFIACICSVLALDERVKEEIVKLRSTLFAILGVGTFSKHATFSDPCSTIVLPDIVCKACNHVRDLDIVRDSFTTAHTQEVELADGGSSLLRDYKWHCAQCETPYDTADLEMHLVAIVEWRSMAYQTQDVHCSKCKRARSSPLRKYCECSGSFLNVETPEAFAHSMQIFRGIAEAYSFSWLQDTLTQLGR